MQTAIASKVRAITARENRTEIGTQTGAVAAATFTGGRGSVFEASASISCMIFSASS